MHSPIVWKRNESRRSDKPLCVNTINGTALNLSVGSHRAVTCRESVPPVRLNDVVVRDPPPPDSPITLRLLTGKIPPPIYSSIATRVEHISLDEN